MKQTRKRVWTVAVAAALFAGSFTTAALALNSADVDGSGKADKYDAYALRDALLGKKEVTAAMDIDGNKQINAKDLSLLKAMLLNPQDDSFPQPTLPATMYADFNSGKAGDFFASTGWTNGEPFDCWWYEENAQIKGDHLELTISDNYQNKSNENWKPNYGGGEFRTEKYYSYGYYETCMKAIKNNGVVSSFFTYTGPSDKINGVENPWDEIDIEILGKDTTKVQFNYYRKGKGDHEFMYDLGFDASEGYHKYGFDWQPDKITWYVDGKKAYEVTGDMPSTASKIMMNAWPGRAVNYDIIGWLKQYDGNRPLTASYKWVTYKKADNAPDPRTMEELEAGGQGQDNPQQGESFPKPDLPATMYSNFSAGEAGDFFASTGWTNGEPFDCWWYEENAQIKGDRLELTISDNYQNKSNENWKPNYGGGEFRTEKYYSYGYYETCMKAIKNNGVVSSFFTYTGPSDKINGVENPWDEIDIEILGKDTTKVQFNYYRKGKGDHEFMYDLGFDASQGYHTYGFDWQPDHITWYVDGKKAYEVTGDMPTTASKIMMNAWPGRAVNYDIIGWLKQYDGKRPLTAYYKWVTYKQADNAQPPRTMEQLEAGGSQGQQGQDNPQQGQGQQGAGGVTDYGSAPNTSAQMYSNFRSGNAGDFFASEGWTNGWPFDCWWYPQNAQIKGDHLELLIDRNYQNKTKSDWDCRYSGGEFRTNGHYGYGYYECSFQAIKNDGVVSSFFTYTGESEGNPWDEIDVEVLGKDTTKVQFNYYKNGQGGHEFMYNLGFDASEGYHTYGFDWQPDHITWYVDGKEAHTMRGDMPAAKGRIMMNAWPGRNKPGDNGISDWLNNFNGRTGLIARYQWVTYNPSR